MKPIVTLTLNPCIDGSCETAEVHPTHKIRTTNERYDPGGGGINVARVIGELGGAAEATYLGGGPTGYLLEQLLAERKIDARRIVISDVTRISHAVYETSTGKEYRFVPEGPQITADEWLACLATLETLDFDWLVNSGSPPRGLPETAGNDLARLAAKKHARYVLDTSGSQLAEALKAGSVHLAKPSIGEFRALTGEALASVTEIEKAAMALVASERVNLLAVTMGHEGAVLASPKECLFLKPPDLPVKSATGAGDSFLGAMVYALAQNRPPAEAFRLGVAAGSAAVLTPGTELCRKETVLDIFSQLE